jgi:N-acetylornithine carbamoyltransferase
VTTAARTPAAPPRAAGPWHLLDLRSLPATEWNELLERAEVLAGPEGRRPLLAGRRLGMLFFNPSLRTRTAFEVACFDLGAHAVSLQVGGNVWGLEHRDGVVMDGDKAEHVKEGLGVLSRMLDGLGVRCFAGLRDAAEDSRDELLAAIARAATVPILNLESAMDHPHQGLADALTLRRRLGRRKARVVVRWAPHVKPLPLAVPHAALLAFAREGHDVVLAHPEGFELDEAVMKAARGWSSASGGSLSVSHDPAGSLDSGEAEAVYVKSWGARADYGNVENGAARLARHRDWFVTRKDLGRAWFLHCLPVRRGVVVADDVLDSDRSLVLEQAEARLHVQKATLCRALGGTP